jgi:nucleoside-diphosphate-sugar epimerase
MHKSIIIFGGQGRTGSEVALLAAEKYNVSVFTYKDSGIFDNKNIRVIEGDVRSFKDVTEAIRGHDAVINIIAPRLTDKKNYDISEIAAKNIIDGMKQHNVKRYQGQAGAWATEYFEDASLPMRIAFKVVPMFKGIYSVKRREDAIVKASGLNWTLVRCGLLADKSLNPNFRVFKDRYKCGLLEIPKISRKSVAAFHVQILEDPSYYKTCPVIID